MNRIVTEKPTVTKLAMKFPDFHAIGSFTAVLRASRQLAVREPHDSYLHPMRVHLKV
jgi:hypothetical protein